MSSLDIAFIGTMDLSVDLGCPGQTNSPIVHGMIAEIESAARRTATRLGIFAPTTTDAKRAIEAGYRYIAMSSDLALLTQAARDQLAPLVELVGHSHG